MSFELDFELSELTIPEGFQDGREVEVSRDNVSVRCPNDVYTSEVTVDSGSKDTRLVMTDIHSSDDECEDGWITLDEVSGSEDELGKSSKEDLHVTLCPSAGENVVQDSVPAEPEDVKQENSVPAESQALTGVRFLLSLAGARKEATDQVGREISVLAESSDEDVGDDAPQPKRPRQGAYCVICGWELPAKNARRHFENEHLPFYWTPYAACEQCKVSEQSLCFLKQRHLNKPDHTEACAFLSEESLLRWVARIAGALHFLHAAFQQDTLENLLHHAVDRGLVRSVEFYGGWEGCLQALDVYLGLPRHNSHSGSVKCVSSLLHWQNISGLLGVLDLRMQQYFKTADMRASAKGPLRKQYPVAPWSPEISTVDSHCHLDRTFEKLGLKSFAALKSHHAAGGKLQFIVSNFVFPESWNEHHKLDQEDSIFYTFGLHPHCASQSWPIGRLRKLLRHSKTAAIGELGLDFPANNYRDQEALVRKQLRMAVEFRLPVVVHCRGTGAYERMLAIMQRILPRHHQVQLHCFAGNHQVTQDYISAFPNVWFSLGGLLFHHLPELELAVQGMDISRILLETDSPYLSPPGVPYHKNQPWNVFQVAQRVAQLKNLPVRVITDMAELNAHILFDV